MLLYQKQLLAARPKQEVLEFWAQILDINSKQPIQYASRVLRWAEFGVEATVLPKNIPRQWPIPRNYFNTEAPWQEDALVAHLQNEVKIHRMSGPFDSLDQVAQVLNTDQVFCLPAKPVKKLVKARQSSQFKFGKKWLSHEQWSELEKAVQNNLKIEDLCGRWTWDFSYTGKRDRSGLSVNSAFKHNVYIKLPTLKEILTVAFDKGLRYGAKCDYENGFRLAKLGPSMRRFGIYQAKGRFYIDLRVSMGHSASPKLYQETTSTIVQAYKRYAITHLGLRTVPHIWVFLDDTMILGKTEQETRFLLTEYMKFTEKLGFKIKASKTV